MQVVSLIRGGVAPTVMENHGTITAILEEEENEK
jgi:hypothetical protein